MEIKCKMTGCSNSQSVGMEELNNNGTLIIDENRFYFNNIRSSKLKTIEFDDEMIIIQTLNTEYIFTKEN